MTRHAYAGLTACLVVVITSACTVIRSQSPTDTVAASTLAQASISEQQIALDFVSVVTQLVPLEGVLLSIPKEQNVGPVLGAMRDMLSTAGYAFEVAGEGDGEEKQEQLLNQRVLEIGTAGEQVQRHDVIVGNVELRRSYRSTGSGKVLPASALFVRGADASAIVMMDKALFGSGNPKQAVSAQPPLPQELLREYAYLFAETPVIGQGNVLAESTEGENVRELGRSNYAARLDALATVVVHVLEFPPGSDRLDAADVALINDALARFEESTDVFSIIGYSAGGAAGPDANRDMALRRAGRVRDALMAVGIPTDLVLVEGYWGGKPNNEAPSRAVTLSLKRGTI